MLTKLIILIILAFILLKIPIVGKYVAILDTLIHEVGHAIMAKVTGGTVAKIQLHANTEGTAWTQNPFWIGRVLTSMAGYPFASAMAFLFLYFIQNGEYSYVLLILLSILLVSFFLWLRNIYGFLWSISIGALFYGLFWLDNDVLTQNVLLCITAILFVESLLSAFDVLKLSFKTPRQSGDAWALYRAVKIIPPQVWGVLFFAQAVAFSYFGIALFI